MVETGGEIRIASAATRGSTEDRGYPAYRVLFNPRPEDLGIAPRYLASAHRRDAPTTTVLDLPRGQPTRNARFRVPGATPAGLYMVLIFDGGEGGAHNTWDYVHVITDREDHAGVVGAASERRRAAGGADRAPGGTTGSGTPRWTVLGGAGAACLLIGAAGGAVLRRRRGVR